MAYRLTILPPDQAGLFLAMTFPAYRGLLGGTSLALGAWHKGVPTGLALCGPGPKGATLLSLFVDPAHRANGLGTELLGHLETVLASQGMPRLSTVWSDAMSGAQPFVRILEKRGWTTPGKRMLVMDADLSGRFGQSLRRESARYGRYATRHCLPRGWSMAPWAEMTRAERSFIKSQRNKPGWHTPKNDPLREEGILDPNLSLLLKKNDQIVGWLSVHRPIPDTVRFTDVFLCHPTARTGAVTIAMVAHEFWRLLEQPVKRLTWAIQADNTPLVTMCRKRLWSWADFHWTWGANKLLPCNRT